MEKNEIAYDSNHSSGWGKVGGNLDHKIRSMGDDKLIFIPAIFVA